MRSGGNLSSSSASTIPTTIDGTRRGTGRGCRDRDAATGWWVARLECRDWCGCRAWARLVVRVANLQMCLVRFRESGHHQGPLTEWSRCQLGPVPVGPVRHGPGGPVQVCEPEIAARWACRIGCSWWLQGRCADDPGCNVLGSERKRPTVWFISNVASARAEPQAKDDLPQQQEPQVSIRDI